MGSEEVMPEITNFMEWFDHHLHHQWYLTMACDGEQIGVIAECWTCGIEQTFGIVDPIEVILSHCEKHERFGYERYGKDFLARA